MDPFDREAAAAVWSRVTAGTAAHSAQAQEEKSAQAVLEFYRDELSEHAAYAAMARKCRGHMAATLRALAREEAGHAKRLAALYFARTGQRVQEKAPPGAQTGPLADQLRERYRQETAGAALYARAAEQDASSRALYTRLSGDELRHSEIILRLIGQCLPGLNDF